MLITQEELALRRVVLDHTFDNLGDSCGGMPPCGPVRITGVAELAGGEIRIRGSVAALVRSTCDRCTAPVEVSVQQDFDVAYRPESDLAENEDVEIDPSELDVGFYTGEGIKVEDVIREQILLALPMKVLCRPDCRGLCPGCGANLNNEVCRCQQSRGGESPFSELLKHA